MKAFRTLYGGRIMPKLIEGLLELMPSVPPWDEAEYQEWLTCFDMACRIYYRLPPRANPCPSCGHDSDHFHWCEKHLLAGRMAGPSDPPPDPEPENQA